MTSLKGWNMPSRNKMVLVFPPVNNYRRFLIHKLVNEQFSTLTTFSIGGGDARRPVICFKTDYIQPQVTKPKIADEVSNERQPKSPEACPVQPKRERRSYAMPSITIYRPPAARRLEDQTSNQEREPINNSINGKHDCKCPSELDESGQMQKKIDASSVSVFKNAISSIRTQNEMSKCKSTEAVKKTESTVKSNQVRLRRPDMKVYVPKAKRMLDDQQKPSKEDSAVQNEISIIKDKPLKNVVQNELNSNAKISERPKKPSVQSDVNSAENSERLKKSAVQSDVNSAESSERLKKPAVQSDANGAKISERSKKPAVQSDVNGTKNIEQPKRPAVHSVASCAKKSEQLKRSAVQSEVNGTKNSEQPKRPAVQSGNNETRNSEIQKKPVQNEFYSAKHSEEQRKTREHSENLESNKKQCESSSVCIKSTSHGNSRTIKFEAKTAYPVSPSSLWIEAQNEVDEVAAKKLSSLVPAEKSVNNCSDTNASKSSSDNICDRKGMERDSPQLNPEECDWETMFDDSGECLDPSLMEQLSSAVGAVTIEKPKSNYDTFRTKSLDLVGDEFPHVIEIYNFPPEFSHQDLVIVFSQFKNAGFEIKWVDDTHALGIFGNAQIVSEVLALRHPFVKTRLLKDGTMLSKEKARRFAEHLLPYKPRPDTCPALARRLVTGALGVRLPTSREEREAERKILSEARERKRQEARQREEAWEGTFH